MKLSDYLKTAGITQARFAATLGVSQGLVWQWITGRIVPPPVRAMQIEQATSGAVRRWELRPADWHRIWPELVGADGAPAVDMKEVV